MRVINDMTTGEFTLTIASTTYNYLLLLDRYPKFKLDVEKWKKLLLTTSYSHYT